MATVEIDGQDAPLLAELFARPERDTLRMEWMSRQKELRVMTVAAGGRTVCHLWVDGEWRANGISLRLTIDGAIEATALPVGPAPAVEEKVDLEMAWPEGKDAG